MGDSNVNPTTIWTPTGGFTASSGYGGSSAAYVAPTLIPTPACAFGPTADTSECQAQVQAVEQQNLGLDNNANRAVFVADCLATYPQPTDCYTRTYDQTPVGGYTSDSQAQGPQLYENAGGQFVTPPPSAFGITTPPPQTGSGSAGAARLSFTNLTSGNNSSFKVGDRWQIQISGAPPNAPVSVNGGMNGANVLSAQGSTDANGNWSLNGQMDQSQVGSWQETWRVNNQIVQSLSFTVSPSGSVVTSTSTGGGTQTSTSSTSSSLFGTLPGGSVSIGGTSIPVLALGAAVVVLILVMKK